LAPQVTVFIDYQNAHLSGHEMYCPEDEQAHHCLIDPVKLAECTVRKRAPGGELAAVYAYRGRPDPRHEALSASRSDRQAAAWKADPRLTMVRRPLAYPRDYGETWCTEPAREKGIDVSLAIDVVRMAIRNEFEVGIVFSRDTDLLPAIEFAFDTPGAHLEVATWEGASRLRLKYRQLYCHMLNEQDFIAVRDPRNYA
jgi:uncharacterized LabA/DUF88 family protein